MLIVLAAKRAMTKTSRSHFGNRCLKSCQALPRDLPDAGTHDLHRGHEWPREERGPKKFGS